MTQREEIAALKAEVEELRGQLSALAVAMVELAAKQPVQYVPYVAPIYPQPYQWWPYPTYPQITYGTTYTTTLDGQTIEASAG